MSGKPATGQPKARKQFPVNKTNAAKTGTCTLCNLRHTSYRFFDHEAVIDYLSDLNVIFNYTH